MKRKSMRVKEEGERDAKLLMRPLGFDGRMLGAHAVPAAPLGGSDSSRGSRGSWGWRHWLPAPCSTSQHKSASIQHVSAPKPTPALPKSVLCAVLC